MAATRIVSLLLKGAWWLDRFGQVLPNVVKLFDVGWPGRELSRRELALLDASFDDFAHLGADLLQQLLNALAITPDLLRYLDLLDLKEVVNQQIFGGIIAPKRINSSLATILLREEAFQVFLLLGSHFL